MLSEYVYQHIAAKWQGDHEEMHRIERNLAKLGVDRTMLLIIVQEVKFYDKL